MKYLLSIITIVLFFSSCSTIKVTTDYDEKFNFSKSKTFAIKHNNKSGENTLTNDRIINSLENDLLSKGYKKASLKDADLIFVFHINIENKTDIETNYETMGFGRYRYAAAFPSTTTYSYKEGTLIIDALNPKNEKIVYRTVGVDELKEKNTPKKRKEYINKIIKKMMSKFPK